MMMNVLSRIIYAVVLTGLPLGFTYSQLNLDNITLSNSNFGYFDPQEINVACNGSVDLTGGSNGDYLMIAGNQIHLCPGFSAQAPLLTSGNFHAFISNQQLDFSILEPTSQTSYEIYEKIEFGISLPQLESRIKTFLDDQTGQYKPGTTNYNNALANNQILNPYDPAHISVDAVFFKPSDPHANGVMRFGFFYREYQRVASPSYWAANYPEQIDPYEWRVRFSPDEIGTWTGYISIWVNGVLIPENFFFSFDVVPNTRGEKGFVSIASNNQYLQFSNGDQFFPVGNTFAWPNGCYNGGPNCIAANCANVYDHRILPDTYLECRKYIDRLTDSDNGGGGGNFSRLICSPWGWEIEWEKLGNYDTRQIEMFELDEYLKYAEQKGVYLSIAPMLNGELNGSGSNWQLPNYSDRFEWNPYNGNAANGGYNDPNVQFKGVAGVNNYVDFYGSHVAKSIYKNKLRYIESRWGYSPHFVINELLTEIDGYEAYWDDNSINATVENWIDEMGGYIKNTLHSRQLTTGSYLGESRFEMGPREPYHTSLWSKPNIDIVSSHNYYTAPTGLHFKAQSLNNTWNDVHKPSVFNESSVGGFIFFDGCSNIALHNDLWGTAFNGGYGPGLSWEWRRYTEDNWYNTTNGETEKEYIAIRSFFENVNLVDYSYTPMHTYTGWEHEHFELVRDDQHKMYGWLHNRSYNHYTQQDNCHFIGTAGCGVTQPFNTVQDMITDQISHTEHLICSESYDCNSYFNSSSDYFTFFSGQFEQYPKNVSLFFVTGLIPNAKYTIEYYYTSGPLMGTFEPNFTSVFTTSYNGSHFFLDGPPTGGDYPPDWAFIIYLSSESRISTTRSTTHDNTNTQLSERNNPAMDGSRISVSPNPNYGEFIISVQSPTSFGSTIYLTDFSGKTLYTQSISLVAGETRIPMKEELASGIYFIRIDGIPGVEKIIISK